MRRYESRCQVDAPPSAVWAVLTDLAAWPAWVPDVGRVEGAVVVGDRVVVHSATSGRRAFPLRVRRCDPPHALVLEGSLPLGVYRGIRSYTLTPADGGTAVVIGEEHRGPLVRLHRAPDLQPWFDAQAAGLKTRAERLSG